MWAGLALGVSQWGAGVPKYLLCNEIYAGCEFISRGASDDEVVALAVNHAQTKHGLSALDWATLAKFSAAVRSDEKAGGQPNSKDAQKG